MSRTELPEANSEQAKLRRATRYYFGVVVELIHFDSGLMMVRWFGR